MLQRRASEKHAGRPVSQRRFLVETLESRRLLSAVAFGTPVSTTLPSGFVPDKCFPAYFLGGDTYLNSFVLTSKAGDALLLQGQTDGTFTVLQDLHPTGTVLGVGQGILNNALVGTIITTTGLMAKQSDGQFALAAPLAYPSDAIAGNFMLDAGLDRDGGTQGDFIVERFKPNANDPTHGDVILAVFRQHEVGPGNLQYDPEIDSTIATNVTRPPGNEPIVSVGTSGYYAVDNVVVGGSTYINSGTATFMAGTSLGMTPDELASPRYRADLVNQLEGLSVTNVALFPAAPAPGVQDSNFDAVQFFTPNASGGLSRGARADVAPKGTTAGPVIFSDFTMDGPTDIATAVVSGQYASSIAVVPGGSSGYLNPVYVPLPGLIAVVGQHFEVPDLICLTATPQGDGTRTYSIVTLPNTATSGPDVQLTASSTAVYTDQAVTLTARVSTLDFANADPGTTPTVQFFDGSKAVETAVVNSEGVATFKLAGLTAGTHTFTAQPVGLSPADSSNAITLSVSNLPAGGLIAPSDLRVKTNTVLVPGDSGNVTMNLDNLGNGKTTGAVAIRIFASTTPTIVPDSIQLSNDAHVAPNLAAHQQRDIQSTFTIPQSITPGSYYLIAQVAPAVGSSTTSVISQTLVGAAPLTIAWEFGRVGHRSNVKFVQRLGSGDAVTYTLNGPGTGFVTLHDSSLTLGNSGPDYSVSVSATSSRSKLTISQTKSTQSNIVDLTLNSDTGSVDVRTDTPSIIQTASSSSGGTSAGAPFIKVKELSVGTVPYAVTPDQTTQNGLISINGSLGKLNAGALSLTTIDLGPRSSAAVQMNIASLGIGSNITCGVPISSLTVKNAGAASMITAPSIGVLKSTGNFDASLNLTGALSGALTLGSADIGSVMPDRLTLGNPQWAVNGNIGDIRIRGSVTNLHVLAGAKAGSLGELTEPPATFMSAAIRSLTVSGFVNSSVFAAGLDPVDGTVADGNDVLLAGGSFGSISISQLDSYTKIVADRLPKYATIGRQKVSTLSDAHFSLTRIS